MQGVGLFAEAAGLLAILSAAVAIVSLGGLAVARSDPASGPHPGWLRLAISSWSVLVVSICAVAAFALFAR